MIDKRLLASMPETKRYIVFNIVGQWIALLANVVMMFMIARSIVKLMIADLDLSELAIIVGIIFISLIIKLRASAFSMKMSFKTTEIIKFGFREKIFKKLFVLKDRYQDVLSSSEVTQITSEGVDQLENYFGNYIPQFFYAIIAPLTLFLIILPLDMKAAIVLFICVPLIPITIIIIQRWAKRLLGKYWDEYSKMGDSFLEDLQGLTTLKLYEADSYKQKEMDEQAESFRKITMKVLSMQLNSITIMDIVAYGGAAIGMIMALFSFKSGDIDLTSALFIILISADFFLPMRLLGSFFHIAMNGMAASDKMFKLFDIKEPKKDGDIKEEDGDIIIEDLSFAYGERYVLKDIDITIKDKALVAIVGPSGSGKSTIAKLLLARSDDYEGTIEFKGEDLKKIASDRIRDLITYVPSDAHIFKGTVRYNLKMADREVSEERMHEVLKQVELDEYFKELNGLDTMINEGGKDLSGGQRQRLAIARALIKDSPIYIFDEATSNIDVESEKTIMDTILKLKGQKTIVLISHRLANVVEADMIYCLKDGKIVGSGTHKELLKEKGLYHELYTSQMYYEGFMKGALDETII